MSATATDPRAIPEHVRDFEAPNLDGLTEQNAHELARIYNHYSAYLEHTAHATKYRLLGDIECALSFERAAETHYRQLPEWARW